MHEEKNKAYERREYVYIEKEKKKKKKPKKKLFTTYGMKKHNNNKSSSNSITNIHRAVLISFL